MNEQPRQDGYIGIVKHVILLLVTFGIWELVWIYRTTDYLNNDTAEPPRNPVTKLLLCMFVPFYYLYWIYVSGKRIDRLSGKRAPSDMTILCLIVSFFIGLVAPILMQNAINNLDAPEPYAYNAYDPYRPNTDVEAQLRGYKRLLDDGIITPEEYEAKRRQLLGL